ncbi:hypothetical protein SAMN05428951_12075, partial [Pseudomonas sp. OV546]
DPNVGGGLPPIAVCQSIHQVTDSAPSGIGIYTTLGMAQDLWRGSLLPLAA